MLTWSNHTPGTEKSQPNMLLAEFILYNPCRHLWSDHVPQAWSPDCFHHKLPVICHGSGVPSWSGFCVSCPFTALATSNLCRHHADPSAHSPLFSGLPCSQAIALLPKIPILPKDHSWLTFLWSSATQILSETIPASSPTLNTSCVGVMASPPFDHHTYVGLQCM